MRKETYNISFLKEYLKKENIKQAELTEKTGVNQGNISNYINGITKISKKNLNKIIKYFDENGYGYISNIIREKIKEQDTKFNFEKEEKEKNNIILKEVINKQNDTSTFDSFEIINGEIIIQELTLRNYSKEDILLALLLFGNSKDRIKTISKILNLDENYISKFYKNCLSIYKEILQQYVDKELKLINDEISDLK